MMHMVRVLSGIFHKVLMLILLFSQYLCQFVNRGKTKKGSGKTKMTLANRQTLWFASH